jgi:MFS family permease
MTAGRADGRDPMGEPSCMTATTNHQDHATGRPRAEGRPAEPAGLPDRWHALTVSLVASFMTLLDVSIVNVALPSIERDLGASATSVQWVVSGYALAFALALVPAGRLGDTLGRRRMFLIALSAFVLTSGLSGAAPTIRLLVAARLLQGVAGGMLLPQISGLIQELFGGAERGRAFGFLGATVGLATAAGPVIGGLILATFAGPEGWRWVFYVNLPIGLVALALAARLVPAAPGATWRGVHLDLVGSLLLGAGVLSLLLPVVDATDGGLNRLWPLFGLAVVLLPASPGGRPGRPAGVASRCWTRSWPTPPAMPPAWPSGRSTSWGSPASGWCWRCTSRTGWDIPRCVPACRSPRSRSAWPSRRCSPAAWWAGWGAG